MKQFVHLYLPMSIRFVVKQKKKTTHTPAVIWKVEHVGKQRDEQKGKLEIPTAQGSMT